MAILDRWTDAGVIDYGNFAAMASRFNVTELKVNGDYGVFQSTPGDVSILGVYARSGAWAARTNKLLEDFFVRHDGGTYIDVGANIGLTTAPIARNPNVRCIAIEPEPVNFANLMKNVQENCKNDNVTALQVAAFSKKTVVEFEIAAGNLGDHRVRINNEPGSLSEHTRRTIHVDAAPLDELVGSIEGALAVKVDTQGAEPFVIEGGEQTLGRAELVIMEFWPYGMRRMGGDPEKVIRYFERHFKSVSMFREEEPRGSEVPIERAAADLRRFVDTKAGIEPFYLDLIGTR